MHAYMWHKLSILIGLQTTGYHVSPWLQERMKYGLGDLFMAEMSAGTNLSTI